MRLKLEIELVPSSSWCQNVRAMITKEEWDTLRKFTYAKFDYRCGICNTRGMLHCHELWSYDDNSHTQTLTGLIALCVLCHHVKHIGLAGILAKKGQLDFDLVVKHFMKVNQCNTIEFSKHYDSAINTWEERSKHQWYVDVGELLIKTN